MKRFVLVHLLVALALPVSVLLTPHDAEAIPAFARQTKQKCTYCHVAFPKLNEFGITFKNNGYRLQGTKGTDVWELPAWPVAAQETVTLTIQAQAAASGIVTNTATFSGTQIFSRGTGVFVYEDRVYLPVVLRSP